MVAFQVTFVDFPKSSMDMNLNIFGKAKATDQKTVQEISNRTHGPPTPKKPEYLIARSQLTEQGPLGFGPIQFLMESKVSPG